MVKLQSLSLSDICIESKRFNKLTDDFPIQLCQMQSAMKNDIMLPIISSKPSFFPGVKVQKQRSIETHHQQSFCRFIAATGSEK